MEAYLIPFLPEGMTIESFNKCRPGLKAAILADTIEDYQNSLENLIIGNELVDELEIFYNENSRETRAQILAQDPVNAEIVDEYTIIPKNRVQNDEQFHKVQAILKYVERWMLMPSQEERDLDAFIARIRPQIDELIETRFNEAYNTGMRISHHVEVLFRNGLYKVENPDGTFSNDYKKATLRAKPMKIIHIQQHHNNFDDIPEDLRNRIEKFTNTGSGWVVDKIIRYDIHLSTHVQYVGGSYMELAKWLYFKKAIVNPKNEDNKCFQWAVLAALHQSKHNAEKISSYKKHVNNYNWDSLTFPVDKSEIKIFEANNIGIKVNLYAISREQQFPFTEKITVLRHAPDQKITDKVINLLLVWNSEEESEDEEIFYGKAHYCWIKDMSRFTSASTGKVHKNYVCTNCCNGFTSEEGLQKHYEICVGFKAQHLEFPKVDKDGKAPVLKFNPEGKSINRYYVVADLEADIKKIKTKDPNKGLYSQSALVKSKTTVLSIHKVNSFKLTIVDRDNMDKKPIIVRDTATIQECIMPEMLRVLKEFSYSLLEKGEKLNVFFHNLRGYDSHHILQYIENFTKISCIPDNMERYKCITIDRVVFKDSLQFLDASLDKLVKNFPKEQFKLTKMFFEDEKSLDLVMRKGIYPYSWKTCKNQFKARNLPPIEAFYNDLTDTKCSKKDYAHALAVWRHFKMKTFQEYHDLYLLCDVLLLTDVFNAFCDKSIEEFGLDPVNYVSLPSYAHDAMLKYTGVELELITDPDMYLFFEKGLRGGITTAVTKYAKANNPMVPGYDSSKKTSFIVYVDKNNLYGHAMRQKLPHSNYRWATAEEIAEFNTETLKTFDFDGDTGYAFEVDAYTPKELHDKHSDFPLAPEHRIVPFEELSPYTLELATELNIKPTKNKKLMCTLHDKEKYVVHGKTLQLYVNLGLVVTKIHRVVKFYQEAWLKPYIDMNTEKRAIATTDFDKDFYKLMNNSVFGKTMENVRSRVNVKLAGVDQLKKLLNKPNLDHINIISENLAAVQMKQTTILMNKPIQIGFTILDLSKYDMYDYHYNYMKERYPGMRVTLLYTDTDSFIYHVETEDIYADMKEDAKIFDFSGYPKDHPCFSNENKKVVGKMKDELNGVLISEHVGLKAKMYALDTMHPKPEDKEIRKAKGTSKSYVKNKLTFQAYKDVLHSRKITQASVNKIQSKNHQLYTQNQNRIALSPYDDKRYVLNDGIHTLAYGHYRIGEL